MREFFDTTIKYFNKDQNKRVKVGYFVQALSFTEGEANITQFLEEEEGIESFEVTAMKRNRYEAFIFDVQEEEAVPFFNVKAKLQINGQRDLVKTEVLVAAKSVRGAERQVVEFMADNDAEAKVYYVKKLDISDVILTKEEKGRTIVLGFEEQRRIDFNILKAEDSRAILKRMNERGEIEIKIKK